MVGHLASACRSSGTPQPKAKGGGDKKGKGGKCAGAAKTRWNCGESGHLSIQCPKKVHAVERLITACKAGGQEPAMVDAIGSCLDYDSVSDGILEPSGAGEEICFVVDPIVREGEFADIEVDSGAEVICFSANIGVDTYPLYETRLSMCGGHHVAAYGGKLHEYGARILELHRLGGRISELEAANVPR